MENDKNIACDKNCNIREMTRKECYEYFRDEAESVKKELMEADTAEAVETAVDEISELMEKTAKVIQLEAVGNWTSVIRKNVNAVKKHDCTRTELVSLLEEMLEHVESLISEEMSRERIDKLRAFFLECAENAEAIAELVDLNKIVG